MTVRTPDDDYFRNLSHALINLCFCYVNGLRYKSYTVRRYTFFSDQDILLKNM